MRLKFQSNFIRLFEYGNVYLQQSDITSTSLFPFEKN